MPTQTPPPGYLTADPGTVEQCPVLTRVRAFVGQQGVASAVVHVVRDRTYGLPVDLTPWADGSVVMRFREVTALPSGGPAVEVDGHFADPQSGAVWAQLSPGMVARPGLYRLAFGVKDSGGALASVTQALLSVEPTLFDDGSPSAAQGPPTLAEVRMAVRDCAPHENLLLRELEYGDDQIVNAVVRPVRYWNEQPPPLDPFDTGNFPFREMWLRATVAVLYETAAAGYRRSHLPYQAGGVSVDDQAKEASYTQAAQALQAEWQLFVREKKIEINHALFCGTVSSPYEYYAL